MKIQLKGHCQFCGRIQVVVNGLHMSKHGYTVENGWFNGVCNGDRFAPIEKERSQTDTIIESVLSQVAELEIRLEKLNSGEIKPKMIKVGYFKSAKTIPFEEATAYEQKNAVQNEIHATASMIRNGRMYAEQLKSLADDIHGKSLIEVPVDEKKPVVIAIGEKRVLNSSNVATVVRVEGARIYWIIDGGRKGWTGSSAWRKLKKC